MGINQGWFIKKRVFLILKNVVISKMTLKQDFTVHAWCFNISEPVSWLVNMIKDCQSWAGLSLKKPINRDKRDLIKTNQASVLDLRNYLFSRQCALLFLLSKQWEVAKRAIEYLHYTVQEIRNLKVSHFYLLSSSSPFLPSHTLSLSQLLVKRPTKNSIT